MALWCLLAPGITFGSSFFSGAGAVPRRKYAAVAAGCNESAAAEGFNQTHDQADPNFYNNPDLSYTIHKPIKNRDEKREAWLRQHPSFLPGSETRILMVTETQAKPCRNQVGDHLLLRLFKNKADYSAITLSRYTSWSTAGRRRKGWKKKKKKGVGGGKQ
ncbi:hypothetical protein DM860_009293 [Cuscuta australis]|uniref:Uncharacterized protein n=1 Tax=Cuscuta australis TaxID=267555 RepID=A0A328DBM6_9ASTE|nr:hypothetical protein DM860_009293 [Cuscuta australis]